MSIPGVEFHPEVEGRSFSNWTFKDNIIAVDRPDGMCAGLHSLPNRQEWPDSESKITFNMNLPVHGYGEGFKYLIEIMELGFKHGVLTPEYFNIKEE